MKHPHGRGEDPLACVRTLALQETPPRAWGRLVQIRNLSTEQRNTPTGVGKTTIIVRCVFRSQKHPHGRGEDLPKLVTFWVLTETPPRAWGRR